MAYDNIGTAAFVPASGTGPLHTSLYTLTFPEEWRRGVLEFYAQTRSEKSRSGVLKYGNVPLGRLNQLMRAVAPGLVSIGRRASVDSEQPWLYSEEEYSPAAMKDFLNAWLFDMAPKDPERKGRVAPRAHRPRLEALSRMGADELEWRLTGVNLLEAQSAPDGTCVPEPHLYRLLPERVASRLAVAEPYEFGGRAVTWRRVATEDGAELVSWPPNEYVPRTKKGGTPAKTWYYSAYLRAYLRSEPFSPVPRIHVETGVHRWVSGSTRLRGARGVSAYLLSDASLLPGGPKPERFAVAFLNWDPRSRQPEWRHGGPQGMLTRLSVQDVLPAPDVLVKDSTEWLAGRQGLTVALTHHNTMGTHKVGAGIMPEERRRLLEWAAGALAPKFIPAPNLDRVTIPGTGRRPAKLLERHKPIGNKKLDSEQEAIREENRKIDARNGDLRRPTVAMAVDGHELSVLAFYQDKAARDRLVKACETSLNLTTHRWEAGPDTWTWTSPELTVRLHTRQVGELTSSLGEHKAPRKGQEFERACADRRELAKVLAQEVSGECGDTPELAFIELRGQWRPTDRKGFEGFRPTQDPKGAIRSGFAEAGLVTQFVRPLDLQVEVDERVGDAEIRTASAWTDGLRQLGVRLIPRHVLGAAIPDRLSQVAFWMVKRQVDSRSNHRQFTPVAVLSKGDGQILGTTPDHDQWVPYPRLLRDLTGRSQEERSEEMQKRQVAVFVKNVLRRLRGSDTLVMAHAQNSRNRWPWLTNAQLHVDRINFGEGPLQRIGIHGKKLRIAHVTSNERAETPQWWAPKTGGSAGFSTGLWEAPDNPTGRVFYSSADKADTMRTNLAATKLTPHMISREKKDKDGNPVLDKRGDPEMSGRDMHRPEANAATPQLLRFTMAGLVEGDDPRAWATFLHQQRDSEDYRGDLGLPVLLHMARKTDEYALPYEQVEDAVVQEDDEGPGQLALFTTE